MKFFVYNYLFSYISINKLYLELNITARIKFTSKDVS